LGAASEIIQKNTLRFEKNLFTKNKEGEKISLAALPDETLEAFFVAETTQGLIDNKVHPEEIAVLYRANFQSRALEEAFLAIQVPYQVIGTRFFERKEVKDILAFIHAAENPESLHHIKRVINVPPRGIGKVTIAKIFAGEKNNLPSSMQARVKNFYNLLEKIKNISKKKLPADLIKFILKETRLKKYLRQEGDEGNERLENIKELVSLASRYNSLPEQDALEKFLEDAALAQDQDALLKNKEGVRLMTVHASKGLEFPYVFVTGLEQGLFPHEHYEDSDNLKFGEHEKTEEERRLFYVALTRTAKKLYLTYTESRMIFGSREMNTPSEFLSDISSDLLELEYFEMDDIKIID